MNKLTSVIVIAILLVFMATTSRAEIAPEVQALFDKAEDHLNKKDYEKAIEFFSKYLQIYPDDSGALNDRGVSYLRAGLASGTALKYYSAARADFKRAAETESVSEKAGENLKLWQQGYTNMAEEANRILLLIRDREKILDEFCHPFGDRSNLGKLSGNAYIRQYKPGMTFDCFSGAGNHQKGEETTFINNWKITRMEYYSDGLKTNVSRQSAGNALYYEISGGASRIFLIIDPNSPDSHGMRILDAYLPAFRNAIPITNSELVAYLNEAWETIYSVTNPEGGLEWFSKAIIANFNGSRETVFGHFTEWLGYKR